MNQITIEELSRMHGKAGLIIQGCGGDLNEWVDGINNILTEEGILLKGDRFRDVSAFENEGVANLLFYMEGVQLDIGKLAMWRLQTHHNFYGTWLSDYLDNYIGREDSEEMEEEREW